MAQQVNKPVLTPTQYLDLVRALHRLHELDIYVKSIVNDDLDSVLSIISTDLSICSDLLNRTEQLIRENDLA